MSSSKGLLHRGWLAAALLVPALGLAGCGGLTPVYGEHGLTQQRLELAYSEPDSRLDQIVIQELALKLGRSASPGAPLVTISSTASSRALTQAEVAKARTERQAEVTISYTVVDHDRIVASGTRRATAGYGTVGQVLADAAAYGGAVERAVRAAAETVRLSILGALATPRRSAALPQ